jgi:hypothetical protein
MKIIVDNIEVECHNVRIISLTGLNVSVVDKAGLVYLGKFAKDAVCTIAPDKQVEWKGFDFVTVRKIETDSQGEAQSSSEHPVPQNDGVTRVTSDEPSHSPEPLGTE